MHRHPGLVFLLSLITSFTAGVAAQNVPRGPETFLGAPRGDLRAFTHAVVDAGADFERSEDISSRRGDSRAGHAWLASSADAAFVEVRDVLGLDVDTPEDLLLASALRRETIGVD